jgi:hypothetical protein
VVPECVADNLPEQQPGEGKCPQTYYVCWRLVLKCYESRTRQHKMLNIKSPSSFKSLFPLGYNEFRTKVMKGVPL